MFGHIRRHQKWLMVVFSALVIVSFVIFIDPTTGRRGRGISRGGSSEFGYMNGRAISAEEFAEAKTEAKLEYLFSTGRWPEEDESSQQFFNLDNQIPRRLFLAEKLRDFNIQATDDAVADWIAREFRDRKTGAFQIEVYQQFAKTRLPRGRVSEPAFLDFVRHQVGIEQLASIAGLSGSLITPREAEAAYRQQNEQLSAEVVLFPMSNYLASVEVSAEALAQYYTNTMANYRIPERVQVSYLKFAATNFLAEADQQLAQVTNLTAQLEGIYQQHGADSYQDVDGKTMPREAAIQKIKEEQRQRMALMSARKKAAEFMEQLDELNHKQPKQLDNLEKLAAATGYQSAVTEPFTQQEGPKDITVFDTFAKAAFALTPEEPMAGEPILSEDAVYVIALKKRIPSEVQPLDAVRDQVAASFRQREATEAAHKAGQAFYNVLTNGLAQAKSFEAVCLEAGVIAHKLPPLSLSMRSLPPEWEGRVDLSLLKDLASNLSPGGTSRFQPTRDGGLIVHLSSRQPVDDAKMKAELPAFVANLRAERRREALSEWFRKEFELVHLAGGPWQNKSGSK